MKHFVVFYDYVADFREKRAPHRAMHLAHANASAARDELQLGGAFADDPPMGMLLFKAEAASVAETFARTDPYVLQGVVISWRVREWVSVVGPQALTQI
ncbi:MAG TPA: YciI-like protein [Caulobacterales bacterium]|nr:YciI-like protein [Caulobacterales bacterium]